MEIKKSSILAEKENKHGDIPQWESGDGKIVHVPGRNLSVTCRANGIDFRRCFIGMSHGIWKKPQYDGVWIDAEDSDQLTKALARRDARAKKRSLREYCRQEARDEALREKWTTILLKRYPGMPEHAAEEIAERATERGFRRVGRSSSAEDPYKAAVIAYIRHEHTDYDDRLRKGEDSCYARDDVGGEIATIFRRWKTAPTNER